MQRKLVFVCLVCQLGFAEASPKDFGQHRGGPVELIADEDGGSFELPVPLGGEIWVKLPGEIRDKPSIVSEQKPSRLKVKYQGDRFRIRPGRDVTKTDAVNLNLDAGTAHYSFLAYVVDAPYKAPSYYVVRTRSAIEAREADVQARLATERAVLAAENARETRLARARQVSAHELAPRIEPRTAHSGPVSVRLGHGEWGDNGEFFATYEITNTGIAPYRVDVAEAFSRQKKIDDVEVLPDVPSSDETLLAVVQPGKSASGVVILTNVTEHDITPLTIVFRGPNGISPIVAKAPDWLIPRRMEDVLAERDRAKANEDRLREELRRRDEDLARERAAKEDAEAGKMSVDLQGVYGAIWLANPLDKEQLDPTSLSGLGARITYGLTRRLNFEAEIIGARTGEAGFQVMDGELMRRAVVGRAQGGMMFRFGEDRFRPLVRLGLGLQGASHTAEMLMEDGSRIPGPNVAFEWTTLLNFGGGMDIRLGDHFAAGFALDVMSEGAKPRSIEAGIHLGYVWQP